MQELGIVDAAFRRILDRYGNDPPSLRHVDFDRHRRFPSLRVFFGNGDDHRIELPNSVVYLPEPERRAFLDRCRRRCHGFVEDRRRGRALPDDPDRDYFNETRERWRREVLADPEIGGANNRRAMESVRDLIGNHTRDQECAELLSLFEETGLGDNPTFLRFLHRLAQRQEDELRRVERMVQPPVIMPAFEPGDIGPNRNAFEVDNWREAMRVATIDTSNMTATEVDAQQRLHEREQRAMAESIERIHRDMTDAMLYGLAAVPAPEHRRFREFYQGVGTVAYEEAARRGMALLKSWLTPEQLAQFEREHQFDVIGSSGQRRYRIVEGSVQNVFELDDGGNVRRGLCFAPAGNLVAGDVMLAQKIALETDEEGALRVANPFGNADYSIFGELRMAPGAVNRVPTTSLPAAIWQDLRDRFF